MFSIFLKVAFRNLFKNRASTLINLTGMSIAIAACVVTFLYIDFWLRKDNFQENAENIYMLGNVIVHESNAVTWGATPVPLGTEIRNNCPSVENVSRLSVKHETIISENDAFMERVHFVEKDFFKMFSFQFKEGSYSDFDEPNSIYLTEEMSKKYFGNNDAVGQSLEIQLGNSRREQLTVKGILKNPPETSSLTFDFILPYENLQRWDLLPLDNWEHWTTSTFIQMREGESPESLNDILDPFLAMQRDVNGPWGVQRLEFFNLLDLTRQHHDIRMNMIDNIDNNSVLSLGAISLILILLASFNYANNRVVSLSRRFREIGIRKVVGSTKMQLIYQFIGENILLVSITLVAGIFIAEFLFIPGLQHLFNHGWNGLELQLSARTIIFMLTVLLVTSLGAGAYPAFIVSRFMPADVFRGTKGIKGQSHFVKIMITLQFSLTLLALIIPVGLYQNAKYQMTLDWGYNQSGILSIPVINSQKYELLETELKRYPDIVSIAGGRDHIGSFVNVASVDIDGASFETHSIQVGAGYLETMGMRVINGRTFGNEYKTSMENEIIVNHLFLEEHNWETATGKTIKIDDKTYTIVGVIEDFHTTDFRRKIAPMVIRVVKPDEFRYMVIRLPEGRLASSASEIKKIFRETLPDVPYLAFFQDESFDYFYRNNMSILGTFTFAGSAALLIAVMGLFGLVSATLQNREKEIGIRKVLGATVSQIIQLITSPIAIILVIGSIVAMLPGWFLLKTLIENIYEYHQDMNVLPFVFSFLLLMIVSLATIILQSVKSALANPVDSIRNE